MPSYHVPLRFLVTPARTRTDVAKSSVFDFEQPLRQYDRPEFSTRNDNESPSRAKIIAPPRPKS